MASSLNRSWKGDLTGAGLPNMHRDPSSIPSTTSQERKDNPGEGVRVCHSSTREAEIGTMHLRSAWLHSENSSQINK